MRTQINIWGKRIMAFSKKAEGTTKGKKHFGIFFLFLHIMTGALLSPSLKAATIYPSDSYNWIFLEGRAITFVVYGSAGVTYTVKDYWGNSKASGSVTTSSGSVTLDLVTANYPMGWYEISVSDAQGTQTVKSAWMLFSTGNSGEQMSTSWHPAPKRLPKQEFPG
jgi:hypothetical protein